MDWIVALLIKSLSQVWHTFSTNWPFLALGAIIAAVMQVYVDQNKVAAFLKRNRGSGVLLSTAVAVGTPLCSCGTTAVILGMMATTMPWAPIVAFMVASPLTSPEGLFYSAGLFGWPFAAAFFAASIFLGLLGGLAANILENWGLLKNQARFRPISGGSGLPAPDTSVGIVAAPPAPPLPGLRVLALEVWRSARRLVVFFFAFAFAGYFVNGLIPADWVPALFSGNRIYGIPLAATLGLPFYINSEASLPLVLSLLDSGMSQGAALAFLITGAGTSIGAISGALTIARWRVVGLVIGTLWLGAVITGLSFNALVALGLV